MEPARQIEHLLTKTMPKKGTSTFAYPGSKTVVAPWIIDHLPEHNCYVEPFGGAASVLFQKDRSTIEVYNDLDSALVNLFEVIRERGDELQEWLDTVPYSRELFEQWAEASQPDDPLERAGRRFALHCMSHNGKVDSPSFRTRKTPQRETPWQSPAGEFSRNVQNIDELKERFRTVIVEHLDYSEVLEKYDQEGTVFYCDPPYVDCDYYVEGGEFNHTKFVRELEAVTGKWLLSYDVLPNALDTSKYHIVSRSREWTLSSEDTEGTEKLVMNFDPEETPMFSEANQTTLKAHNSG